MTLLMPEGTCGRWSRRIQAIVTVSCWGKGHQVSSPRPKHAWGRQPRTRLTVIFTPLVGMGCCATSKTGSPDSRSCRPTSSDHASGGVASASGRLRAEAAPCHGCRLDRSVAARQRERLCERPTAGTVLDLFDPLARSVVIHAAKGLATVAPSLNPLTQRILRLLDVPLGDYEYIW